MNKEKVLATRPVSLRRFTGWQAPKKANCASLASLENLLVDVTSPKTLGRTRNTPKSESLQGRSLFAYNVTWVGSPTWLYKESNLTANNTHFGRDL